MAGGKNPEVKEIIRLYDIKEHGEYEADIITQEKQKVILESYKEKKVEVKPDFMIVLTKKFGGLCKGERVPFSEVDKKLEEVKGKIDEARKKLKDFEDRAGDDSEESRNTVNEGGGTKMNFTGKCIMLLDQHNHPGKIASKFSLPNYQNCCCNCLSYTCSCIKWC